MIMTTHPTLSSNNIIYAERGDERLWYRLTKSYGLRFSAPPATSPWYLGKDLPNHSHSSEKMGSMAIVTNGRFQPNPRNLVTGVLIQVGQRVQLPHGELRCFLQDKKACAAYFSDSTDQRPKSIVLTSNVPEPKEGDSLDVGSFTWFSDRYSVSNPWNDNAPDQVHGITLWQLMDLGTLSSGQAL